MKEKDGGREGKKTINVRMRKERNGGGRRDTCEKIKKQLMHMRKRKGWREGEKKKMEMREEEKQDGGKEGWRKRWREREKGNTEKCKLRRTRSGVREG